MQKKIILLLLFLQILISSLAQGNLQFSKVVFIEADTSIINCLSNSNCADSFLIRDIIVASGKVLKIESINTRGIGSSSYRLYFNSFEIPDSFGPDHFNMTYPIWLPQGNYQLKYKRTAALTDIPKTYSYLFSALEFNIIP